jgi:hypothetical protein
MKNSRHHPLIRGISTLISIYSLEVKGYITAMTGIKSQKYRKVPISMIIKETF